VSSSSSRRRSRRSSRRGSEGGERPGERGQRDEATLRSIACRRRMRPLCAISSCTDVRRRVARCGSPQGRWKGPRGVGRWQLPERACVTRNMSKSAVIPGCRFALISDAPPFDPCLQTESAKLAGPFRKGGDDGTHARSRDVRRQPNEPWFDGGQAPAGGLKRLGPRAGSPEPQYNRDLPARRE
jgi:hypothetical protein